MKTTDVSRYGRLFLAGLLVLAAAACDEEKTPDDTTGGNSTSIKVDQIIVQPKVAAPDDTLLFTAVVTSSSSNEGDIPVMDWTATGGAFVEDDQLSVRWVAPAGSGIYTVTARATNSVNSSTGKADVFVGAQEVLVPNNAGAVRLITGGPDFYFLRSGNVANGVDVSSYIAGVASDAVDPLSATTIDVTYAPDLTFEVHARDSVVGGILPPNRPRHIYVGNFATKVLQGLTIDRADPVSPKRQQFSFPAVSPNSQLVAYQGFLPNPDGTQVDSFHVFVHNLVAGTRAKITGEHPFPRNFFPTFSTDGQWLTYVSDQTGTGQWDLYGSPVSGNVVDGSLASLVRLTDTGGALVSGTPATVKKPLSAWNPVSPILAVLASDGVLYLVQTTNTGSNVTDVPGLSGVQELAWSPSGALLAASAGGRIVTITPGGAATTRVTGIAGDLLRDLCWSPDEAWLVYRVTRGGNSWFELLDLDAGVLTAPLPVTSATTAGAIGAYRAVMSMSPAWTATDRVIFPIFGVDTAVLTPGLVARDLSGLVD